MPAPAASEAPAVRCRELVKRYPRVTAVDGLSLEVRRGECFGLLGPNGAGKTTTVEILEGLTAPDAGTVELFGWRWGDGRDAELRRRLGVQLQEAEFPDKLTVREVLRLFRSFHPRGREVESVIELVELGEKRDARVEKLSGGQKQRLALAAALVGDPDLLFLDEPTTGLDPQARLKTWQLVEEFVAGGGTVLLTTHYMEEAARLCGRVGIMDHGRIIAADTPRNLVASLGADQIVEAHLGAAEPAGLEPRLAGLPGVREVARRDGAIVLTVFDMGAALPALLGALGAAGARLEALNTHQASLEDVFVHLTGRGLREG
jgi:ABC-2 type transport system ATP-binding protein